MPRILPALGAVAIIAFSIGFNIVQYPVVWDMVAPSAQSPVPAAEAQKKRLHNPQNQPNRLHPYQATNLLQQILLLTLPQNQVVKKKLKQKLIYRRQQLT